MKKHPVVISCIAVIITLIAFLAYAFHSATDASSIVDSMANIQIRVDEDAKQDALDAFDRTRYAP